jgi:voltage-gated potassium channel
MVTTLDSHRSTKLWRRLAESALTPRRAAQMIVALTLAVTIIGGVLIWLVDHDEFPNLGTSLWWSLQTVTTVGYGDVVPHATSGRVIGAVLMLQGIGFITVVAAAVTASLIEQARGRSDEPEEHVHAAQLDRIEARLAAIERGIPRAEQPGPPGTDDPTRRG